VAPARSRLLRSTRRGDRASFTHWTKPNAARCLYGAGHVPTVRGLHGSCLHSPPTPKAGPCFDRQEPSTYVWCSPLFEAGNKNITRNTALMGRVTFALRARPARPPPDRPPTKAGPCRLHGTMTRIIDEDGCTNRSCWNDCRKDLVRTSTIKFSVCSPRLTMRSTYSKSRCPLTQVMMRDLSCQAPPSCAVMNMGRPCTRCGPARSRRFAS